MEAGHSLSPDTSRKSSSAKSVLFRSEAAPPPSCGALTKLLAKRKNKSSFKRNYETRDSRQSSCSHPFTTGTSTPNSMTIVKSRGYSISRTPSHVEMNIDTTTFFGSDDDDDQIESLLCLGPRHSKDQSQPSSGDTVDTLTQQIEKMNLEQLDVQVQLIETRRAAENASELHKEQTAKLLMEFDEEKKAIKEEHDEELSVCRNEHEDEIITLNALHREKILNIQMAHEKAEARLQEEIECAEKQHKIAMAEVRKESANTNSRMKARLQKAHKEELEMMEDLLRKDSLEKMQEIREDLAQQHKEELQEMDEKHQREMESILEQFSKIHEVEEELEKAKKYIRKLERQSSRLKTEVKKAHSSQQEAESQLLEAKTELELFKADFQRKISEAQSKTKDRLDELMLENIQLRKKHIAKSEELAKYRANVERSSARTVQDYREKVCVMVKARSRANLSVALGLTEEVETNDMEPRVRPSSAPVTRAESSMAQRHILSSEPNRNSRSQKPSQARRPKRPKSCLPNL